MIYFVGLPHLLEIEFFWRQIKETMVVVVVIMQGFFGKGFVLEKKTFYQQALKRLKLSNIPQRLRKEEARRRLQLNAFLLNLGKCGKK